MGKPVELDIRKVFRTQGLRHTRQREVIYRALAEADTHPTADELLVEVRRRDPGVSLATVYNALEVFRKSGLCRRVMMVSGSARFDADVSAHVHAATEDGRLLDVPPELSSRTLQRIDADLVRELEQRLGRRISQVAVQFIVAPE